MVAYHFEGFQVEQWLHKHLNIPELDKQKKNINHQL